MKSSRCTLIVAVLSLTLFSFVTLSSRISRAEYDSKVSVKFYGFSKKIPDFFLVQVEDNLSGKTLMVYQIGKDIPEESVSMEDISLKKALKQQPLKAYEFEKDDGAGNTKMKGIKIVGDSLGPQYALSISNGRDKKELGYVKIKSDSTETKFANVTAPKWFWHAEGKKLVVIVNQKLNGEFSFDQDQVFSHKF